MPAWSYGPDDDAGEDSSNGDGDNGGGDAHDADADAEVAEPGADDANHAGVAWWC